jgi:hypothetical protein
VEHRSATTPTKWKRRWRTARGDWAADHLRDQPGELVPVPSPRDDDWERPGSLSTAVAWIVALDLADTAATRDGTLARTVQRTVRALDAASTVVWISDR